MEDDRYTRITLRIPKDLHARLESEADKTSKSLNAEIVGRLRSSFGADSGEGEDADLLRDEADDLTRRVFSIDARMELIRTRIEAVKTRYSMASMRLAALNAQPDGGAKEQQQLRAEFDVLYQEERAVREELAAVQIQRAEIMDRLEAINQEIKRRTKAA